MRVLISFIIIAGLQNLTAANGQGCSDAGFCTIANLKPAVADSGTTIKQKLSIVLNNGIGDENVYVFTPAIQYDLQVSKQWAVQAKITANYASGNLGTASGLGDFFLSGTYTLKSNNSWSKSLVLGTKISLNDGNIRLGSNPLPMQYQSSLGTIDLIAGLAVTNNKWFFAAALQQPLSGSNRNTFLPVYWNTSAAYKYAPSNDFNRKGDVLLRVGYDIQTVKKWKLNLGVLGIYHLGKDSYIDGNISNNPIEIKGSDGLTLNATMGAWYKAGSRITLGLSGGLPFVVRDIRPDGLTRKFVLAPEITFHF